MTAINSNRAIRGPVTAVPVVAGKGVRLVADTENNRIVAEADETELLSSPLSTPPTTASSTTVSETVKNFEKVAIYGNTDDGTGNPFSLVIDIPQSFSGDIMWSYVATNNGYAKFMCGKINGTSFTMTRLKALQWGGGWADPGGSWTVSRVVGINRIASN